MTQLLGILFIIALIVVLPLLSIWSLNTLFPVLVIPYTLNTWFAMFCVGGIFYRSIK